MNKKGFYFLPARRYDRAGTVFGLVSVCGCLCFCVGHKSIETAERIRLVFGMGASFDLSYTVFKEIRYLQRQEYFPLELCSKLWTSKISPSHIDRRSVLST